MSHPFVRPVLTLIAATALCGTALIPAVAAPTPTATATPSSSATTTPTASTAPATTAPSASTTVPTASTAPSASTTPTTPSAAPSASPSATPSRTASVRALAGSVSAPTSPNGPAVGHFTGGSPGETLTLNLGQRGGHQPFQATGTVAPDGTITFSIGGVRWASATTFVWWLTDDVRGTFTTPVWSGYDGTMAASASVPADAHAPLFVTVTGATPNTDVTVIVSIYDGYFAEDGGEATGRTDKNGRAVVRIPAPEGGWRMGELYHLNVNDSAGHGSGDFAMTTFTMGSGGKQPATSTPGSDTRTKAPATQPAPKSDQGGLARTGC